MRRAPFLVPLLLGCSPAPEEEARGTPPGGPSSARLTVTVLARRGDDPGLAPPRDARLRWRARAASADPGRPELWSALARDGWLVEEPTGEGRFELELPADRWIDVGVEAGERRELRSVPPLAAGVEEALTIELPPPVRHVHGVLLEPGGTPVGESMVEVDGRLARVYPDGRFEAVVGPDADEVVLEARGWPPVTAPLPSGDAPFEVRLVPGGELRLTLLEEDGAPAEARLVLTRRGDPAPAWRRVAETDEDGLARATGLPTDRPIEARVRGEEGLLRLELEEPFVLEPGEARARTLRLPGPGPIAGRLLDLEGYPLAGVQVGLVYPPEDRSPEATYLSLQHRVRARTETDETGRFRFEGAPGGTWLLGVARGPWNAQTGLGMRVSPAALPVGTGDEDVELRVAVGLVLRGSVVLPDGSRPRRTLVEARPQAFAGARETHTRRDGSFELEGLMPGPHDLYLDGELVRAAVDPAETRVPLALERTR